MGQQVAFALIGKKTSGREAQSIRKKINLVAYDDRRYHKRLTYNIFLNIYF